MSNLLELPQPALDGPGADADIVHLTCCDYNLARCGKDVTDEPEVFDSTEDEQCEICSNRSRLGAPCADPGCPLRWSS
jgi:hypothetical protein